MILNLKTNHAWVSTHEVVRRENLSCQSQKAHELPEFVEALKVVYKCARRVRLDDEPLELSVTKLCIEYHWWSFGDKMRGDGQSRQSARA